MYITSHTETHEDGDVIFTEGDNGDWVHVIESGAVELSKRVAAEKFVHINKADRKRQQAELTEVRPVVGDKR